MIREIHSLQETARFAEELAQKIQNHTVTLCLDGDLGAGKTTFTKSLGRALGVKSVINSPTFTIMKNYTDGAGNPFTHIDAYRLEGAGQDLGFDEVFDEGISVVEWSQYISDQLPADTIRIAITQGTGEDRTFDVTGTGVWAAVFAPETAQADAGKETVA